jgi:hypothetical protein
LLGLKRRRRRYTEAERLAASDRLAKVRPKTLSGVSVSTQISTISSPAE